MKATLPKQIPKPNPITFYISPSNLKIYNPGQRIPNFKIRVELPDDTFSVEKDFNGTFTVESSEMDIKTIDLQLVRVENLEFGGESKREATEVQYIQIAERNVLKDWEIPFSMMFPRHFTCPSFTYKEFNLEFQVNFVLILEAGFKITHNIPIKIIR